MVHFTSQYQGFRSRYVLSHDSLLILLVLPLDVYVLLREPLTAASPEQP